MAQSLKIQIANKVREILEKKGLRQQDLVDRTGFTKSYISLVLSAKINVTVETIEALEKALGEKIVNIK